MSDLRTSELTGHYTLDPARTRLAFLTRHTMGPWVRGRFDAFEGSARLDGHDPANSTVEVAVQAGSIQTGNPQRDEHLRARFLDVAAHPLIRFASTGVAQLGPAAFRVTGGLTIRGVTRPITVDLGLRYGEQDALVFEGSVGVNRMKWGVNWNAATSLLLAKEVTLELEITAIP
ncbi:YceI family protein [Nonomuraea sp. NPDC050310]|uniref:YceI family protein n=1 Tax=Nonomuraea sp. NPDC050310 TaxID=3154935 RepID=UPI0033FAA6EF